MLALNRSMGTARDPAIAAALVDWVRRFPNKFLHQRANQGKVNTFNLRRKSARISSVAELYDGAIISLILNDIDSKYFGAGIVRRYGATPASTNWVQHFNARMVPYLPHSNPYVFYS